MRRACPSLTASTASGPSIRETTSGTCHPALTLTLTLPLTLSLPLPLTPTLTLTRYLPLSLLPPPRCALEAAHVLYNALHVRHIQGSNPGLADRVPGRPATHTCTPCLGQDAATSLDASELGGPWPADPAHHDTIGRADDPGLARHATVVRSTPLVPSLGTPQCGACVPRSTGLQPHPAAPTIVQPCSPAALLVPPCNPTGTRLQP